MYNSHHLKCRLPVKYKCQWIFYKHGAKAAVNDATLSKEKVLKRQQMPLSKSGSNIATVVFVILSSLSGAILLRGAILLGIESTAMGKTWTCGMWKVK